MFVDVENVCCNGEEDHSVIDHVTTHGIGDSYIARNNEIYADNFMLKGTVLWGE